jgi:hypothetical protein
MVELSPLSTYAAMSYGVHGRSQEIVSMPEKMLHNSKQKQPDGGWEGVWARFVVPAALPGG